VEERRRLRRRADSATVAGDQLLLYRPSGEIARIAVLVDQLDDAGLRTPLVEDVLTAFPHAELHVVEDRRLTPTPLCGRTPTVWSTAPMPRRFWRPRRPQETPTPELGEYDVVLRLGDRRSRTSLARHEALDLTYILDVDDERSPSGHGQLGAGFRDRCAMQSADIVWCSTRRQLANLRRRWHVDAQLLYPPAELGAERLPRRGRRLVLAAADGISAAWNARLDTVARWRDDLTFVHHGGTPHARNKARARLEPPTPERFGELLAEALVVVMPPGDVFDPRAVWAAEAGVPVITPISSASAELVEGLERRDPTGILLEDPTDAAVADAIGFVERHPDLFDATRLGRHAERWSRARFGRTLKSLVLDAWCTRAADAEPMEDFSTPAEAVETTAGTALETGHR